VGGWHGGSGSVAGNISGAVDGSRQELHGALGDQGRSRLKVSQEDLAKQFDLLVKIRDKVTETDDAIIQIRDVREQVNAGEQTAEE